MNHWTRYQINSRGGHQSDTYPARRNTSTTSCNIIRVVVEILSGIPFFNECCRVPWMELNEWMALLKLSHNRFGCTGRRVQFNKCVVPANTRPSSAFNAIAVCGCDYRHLWRSVSLLLARIIVSRAKVHPPETPNRTLLALLLLLVLLTLCLYNSRVIIIYSRYTFNFFC